jgi:hypothetical protein
MFARILDTTIAALDLDPIKFKLIHPESGEGWTREYADMVELEYRRFLFLMKKFPNEETAPLVDVDTFWHYHILDTMKYAADCEMVFGYFLHHFPYLGMRGEEDSVALATAGNRMQELYQEVFGTAELAAANGAGFRMGTLESADREMTTEKLAAYCTRSPQAAYCTRAPQAAEGSQGLQAAYCTRTPAAAYCTRGPQAAYCTRVQQTAYCTRTPDAAASPASAKPAYCTMSAASRHTQHSAGAMFNMTRPSLMSVAM